MRPKTMLILLRELMRRMLVVTAVLGALVALVPAQAQPSVVTPGADVLTAALPLLRGRRVGLVTHHAAVTRDGRPTYAVLAALPDVQLVALFAPEHGLYGDHGAGQRVRHVRGETPIYSLYGHATQPTRKMLAAVDVLVVDLQDVGVRPFTYVSTMALVLDAAARAGKPVVILDRPNPMGGLTTDGPVLRPGYRSFIGIHPIPYVHGMTLGELAQFFNREYRIGALLHIIPAQGWGRAMTWRDTGLVWTNPSPGLLTDDSPFYYAATGAIDGTNLWNGTGTDARYRVILATWIDGAALAERLNARRIPGVVFSASSVPHPTTGRIWRGVRLHLTDPGQFRPSTTTVYVLAEIRAMYGRKLIFRRARHGRPLFDRVWGTRDVRQAIQRGEPAERIVARWQPDLNRFQQARERYLIYPVRAAAASASAPPSAQDDSTTYPSSPRRPLESE
jgi:uncharacterized protein YbbC (DUF1343 family)